VLCESAVRGACAAAGALADRINRKQLTAACDGVRALAAVSIPVALAAGGVPYTPILAVAFPHGSGYVVSLWPGEARSGGLCRKINSTRPSLATNHACSPAMVAGPRLRD
jgi:hypothetical protein